MRNISYVEEPMANSSRLVLPMIRPSSARIFAMAVALSWRDKMIQHPGSAGYPAIFQVDIIFDRDDHAAQFPALLRRLPLLNYRLGKGAIPVCRMRVNLSKKSPQRR